MKKIMAATGIVMLFATVALAEWLTDFRDTFFNDGIDNAVVVAMNQGISPDLIVENGLQFDGLNPANLVKALYCAGAMGQDIRTASEKWGISEIMISAGYRKALSECSNQLADTQAFPVGTATSFVSINPGGGGQNASPSTFPQ